MTRWCIALFIGVYLSLLGYGLACHVVGYERCSHPAMYFLVWDMYCGWSGYESHQHLIAQGDSGTWYELSPPPWGAIVPFGSADRPDYDCSATYTGALALNVLRHTDHEPIRDILLVEECWSKKYNLPEELWAQRYEEPREPFSYFHVHATLTPGGEFKTRYLQFAEQLVFNSIHSNPRLQADVQRNRPFVITDSRVGQDRAQPASYALPSAD